MAYKLMQHVTEFLDSRGRFSSEKVTAVHQTLSTSARYMQLFLSFLFSALLVFC